MKKFFFLAGIVMFISWTSSALSYTLSTKDKLLINFATQKIEAMIDAQGESMRAKFISLLSAYATQHGESSPRIAAYLQALIENLTLSSLPSNLSTYTDEELGFSFDYPSSVPLFTQSYLEKLHIRIQTVPTTELEPNLSDEAALKKGDYGNPTAFSRFETQRVINVGAVNAKTSMIFSMVDICDVRLMSQIVFYKNNHQVTISIEETGENFIVSAPHYFSNDAENCGDQKVRTRNGDKNLGEDGFYNDVTHGLVGPGNAGSVAEAWYNTYTTILNSLAVEE